jgi:3-isopropylmalate/(R)-2-methylmalate dehydratase small subunit
VVLIDVYSGEITNETKGKSYKGTPFPGFIQDIMKAEGLINYVKGERK